VYCATCLGCTSERPERGQCEACGTHTVVFERSEAIKAEALTLGGFVKTFAPREAEDWCRRFVETKTGGVAKAAENVEDFEEGRASAENSEERASMFSRAVTELKEQLEEKDKEIKAQSALLVELTKSLQGEKRSVQLYQLQFPHFRGQIEALSFEVGMHKKAAAEQEQEMVKLREENERLMATIDHVSCFMQARVNELAAKWAKAKSALGKIS